MARGGPSLDAHRRVEFAKTYLSGGNRYDRVRPGYPADVVDWLLPTGCVDAADLGAGTGLFTRLLTARGLTVRAVDPSADMLSVLAGRLPQVRIRAGTAESTGLDPQSVDIATIAQAWHWCDPAATSAEAARILRPGGTLGILWNQLDVAIPWVHRLSRIMHAGDVFSPDFQPRLGPQFAQPEHRIIRWEQPLAVSDVLELAKSRSYYQRASPTIREKVKGNLSWYLYEHLAFAPDAVLHLPYYTHAWRAPTLAFRST